MAAVFDTHSGVMLRDIVSGIKQLDPVTGEWYGDLNHLNFSTQGNSELLQFFF